MGARERHIEGWETVEALASKPMRKRMLSKLNLRPGAAEASELISLRTSRIDRLEGEHESQRD